MCVCVCVRARALVCVCVCRYRTRSREDQIFLASSFVSCYPSVTAPCLAVLALARVPVGDNQRVMDAAPSTEALRRHPGCTGRPSGAAAAAPPPPPPGACWGDDLWPGAARRSQEARPGGGAGGGMV